MMNSGEKIFGVVAIIMACYNYIPAQVLRPGDFRLDSFAAGNSGIILGNGIVDILTRDSLVWVGTGFGLNKTGNGGTSWQTFNPYDYKSKGGISALDYMDDSTVWIATAFDTIFGDG